MLTFSIVDIWKHRILPMLATQSKPIPQPTVDPHYSFMDHPSCFANNLTQADIDYLNKVRDWR
jgi:hypothetical protein